MTTIRWNRVLAVVLVIALIVWLAYAEWPDVPVRLGLPGPIFAFAQFGLVMVVVVACCALLGKR